jgi:hypothetical protein
MMWGMFWGGLVMALPPTAVGIGIAVFLWRQQFPAGKASGADEG